MADGVAFSGGAAKRIIRAVRSVEEGVQDGLRRKSPRGGGLAGPNVQFVKCTSATATASSYYPGLLQDIGLEGALSNPSSGGVVWLRFTSGVSVAPTVSSIYGAIFVGYRVADNVPIFEAVLPITAASSAAFCGVYVTNSTTVSVSTSGSNITFNTESYDTDGFHSTSANTERFTIPTGLDGKYLLGFHMTWSTAGSEEWRKITLKYYNGSTTSNVLVDIEETGYLGESSTHGNEILLSLAAGDYVYLFGEHNDAGAVNVQPIMWMMKVG